MKKGIGIRAFSEDPDFLGSLGFLNSVDDYTRCFEVARESGFDGVQLFLESAGFFSPDTPDKTLSAITTAARQTDLAISSLEIAPFSYSFTTDDQDERARSIAYIRRCLEVASSMEVEGILVIPGWVGLPWDPSAPTVRYDVAFDRTRVALATLAPDAERLGVSLMVENIWNRFLLSPLEMRNLIDEVGSSHVQVLLDVGNLVLFGYPEHWIQVLGSRIKEVHLKDYRQSIGTIDGFVNLLEGDVNWPLVIDSLRAIGYDGFLTAEVFPLPHAPKLIVPQTSLAIDAILAH